MYFPFEMILIDSETTDVSMPDEPEIIEIAGIHIDRSLEVLGKFHSLVRPKNIDNFTDFSEGFTGIRRKTLETCETWETVWKQFAKFTRYTKHRLGAWGIASDIEFLKNSYKQYGLKYNHHKSAFCVMSFVAGVLAEKGIHTNGLGLKNVCKYFDLVVPSHRAMEDVEAMLRVLKKLMYSEKKEKFSLFEV